MEPADINLDNTNTLTGFYKVLEANAIVLDRNHDITELLLKYKNKTNSDDEKQKLQWEIEAFLYSFHGSSIFSFSASNGKEIGEV